jgi:hypothetical protein
MSHQELAGLSSGSTGLTGTMRKNPNLENIGGTAIRMRRRAVIAKSSYTVNRTPSTRPSGARTTLLTTSEVINFCLVLRQERI